MIVGMFFDENASLDETVDEEYERNEEFIREVFPDTKIKFKRRLTPYQLSSSIPDIYLFDIGGMMFGQSMLQESLVRTVLEQVQEKPSTLFVFHSAFTTRWYWELVKEDFPELDGDVPNVILQDWENYHYEEELPDKLRKWMEHV